MSRKYKEKLLTKYILEQKENYYRLAYSYVKNPDDALDIVQESIYKAMLALESLDDQVKIKSWFYRIVVNTALDFLRKQKKVTVLEEEKLDMLSAGQEDAYTDLDLELALEHLPTKYKQVIILRYFEDLKIEEVADILEENVNTIKTRLYRALNLLRNNLNTGQAQGVKG